MYQGTDRERAVFYDGDLFFSSWFPEARRKAASFPSRVLYFGDRSAV